MCFSLTHIDVFAFTNVVVVVANATITISNIYDRLLFILFCNRYFLFQFNFFITSCSCIYQLVNVYINDDLSIIWPNAPPFFFTDLPERRRKRHLWGRLTLFNAN